MRRLIGLTLVFALTIALSAGSASAATKSIRVKVVLTGIAGNDLVGMLESKVARCVKNRDVTLSGDSSDAAQTNAEGGLWVRGAATSMYEAIGAQRSGSPRGSGPLAIGSSAQPTPRITSTTTRDP